VPTLCVTEDHLHRLGQGLDRMVGVQHPIQRLLSLGWRPSSHERWTCARRWDQTSSGSDRSIAWCTGQRARRRSVAQSHAARMRPRWIRS
jgi:hypothetical protein